ncbi:hypothetical protein HELRODRAFT_192950 [Helobdella robusta]|uniref:Uncharacterized protein n=1 Tax=Helobdella robusta TaxID=6412 RepID=T1FUG2_HELRO|nr:hypothetical protein HELRODRAFT_192950 [Helobdella robusta]ESN98480.1 hypothetical protein HELRODRAFT_192950 [Helobdella robusta]
MARKVSKKKVKTVAPKLSSTKMASKKSAVKGNSNSSGNNAPTSIKSPKSSAAKRVVEKEEQPTTVAANNRATRSRGAQSSRTNAKTSDSSLIDKTLTIEIKRISEKPIGSKRTPYRSLKIELEPVLTKKRHVVNDDLDDKKQTTKAKTLRKRNVNHKSDEITSRRVMDRARKPQKYYEDDGNEEDFDDEEVMDEKDGASGDDNSDDDYQVSISNNSAKPSKKKPTSRKATPKKKKQKTTKTTKKSLKADNVDEPTVERLKFLGNGTSNQQQTDNKPGSNTNNSSSSSESSLLNRSYIFNANLPSKDAVENAGSLQSNSAASAHEHENSFTIASYNILADCHAQRDYKTSTWVTAEELSVNSRHERIMQEVKFIDADVYCFQEVGTDYFRNVLKDSMNRLGYDGVYVARLWKEAPYEEGEATFYRTSAFHLLQHKNIILEELAKKEIDSLNVSEPVKDSMKQSVESYAVSLLTQLKSVSGQFLVTVANVHICYDEFKRQDKQCLQVAMTVKELQKLANDVQNQKDGSSSSSNDNNDIINTPSSQIICGDFNSWPTSAPQRLMGDGHLDESSCKAMMAIETIKMEDGKVTSLFSQWNDAFHFDPSHSYQSAYQVVTGSDPHTSRFNMDGEVRQVDFIYFSSDTLIPRKVLAVPEKSDLQNGVPNAIYPSDHISVVAEFTVSK